jgi:hypothetical protein
MGVTVALNAGRVAVGEADAAGLIVGANKYT